MIVALLVLVINLVFCVLVGNYASERGRSMLLWFLLAFITTPILAFILLLILGENESSQSYYPQDDYSPSYNRTPSYSGSTNYTKSKELKKPEIKKLTGKEFFEAVYKKIRALFHSYLVWNNALCYLLIITAFQIPYVHRFS